MKKRILIIKNITHESPGSILEVIERNNIEYDIIDLSKKLEFPRIEDYALIVVMGGPNSANDKSDKIIKELEFIRLALKKKTPIFGICLGMQLLSKAVGGNVYRNQIEEIGFQINNEWFKIKLTELGKKDPIFNKIGNNFVVFQLHGETVELVEGIKLLGTAKFCRNQIIKIEENNYGFQFHFELNDDLLNDWISMVPELKKIDTLQLLKNFNQIRKNYTKRGKDLFHNYLRVIQFF